MISSLPASVKIKYIRKTIKEIVFKQLAYIRYHRSYCKAQEEAADIFSSKKIDFIKEDLKTIKPINLMEEFSKEMFYELIQESFREKKNNRRTIRK